MSFYIFAHEIGHIVNGEIKPSCLCELRADQYSLEQFKRFGLPLPRKVINRSNWYRGYSLAQALNRGMKKIPDELKKYKRYLIKSYRHTIYGDGRKPITQPRYYADNKLLRKYYGQQVR